MEISDQILVNNFKLAFIHAGRVLCVMVMIVGNGTSNLSSNPGCASFHTNALRKGSNSALLLTAMSK